MTLPSSKFSLIRRALACVLPAPRGPLQALRVLYWLFTLQLPAKIRLGSEIAAVRESPLFDSVFYLAHNPDVAHSGVDPAVHFVRSGWREKRAPHPLFDTAYYLDQHPGVIPPGENPLLHFCARGGLEGLNPHKLFDSRFYLAACPDADDAGLNPLEHYLSRGSAEGADPHPLFSTRYYLEHTPECARMGLNPLVHYVTRGAAEGRATHPVFSPGAANSEASRAALAAAAAYLAAAHARGGRPDPNLYRFQWDTYEILSALQRSDVGARPAELAHELRFAAHASPAVSIVIPVFNKALWTLRCLRALSQCGTALSYEVIVVDDGSTDETPELIGTINGLRYVRNVEQLGFLRSCNFGASLARGEFLVLLNNDTVVLPGWLDALRQTFDDFPGCGLAGSKLLYPDGRLQEAGGIVWADGSGLNVGRLDDPAKPEYCYARDADYCSGASLMLPRALWNELGGFDELFAPAYYEDSDLAFRVRKAGRRVIYQALSKVIHFEGVSSGTDTATGVKRFQALNQPKFAQRWAPELSNNGLPNSGPLPLERGRARHALVLDESTPTPDQDSGSIDTLNYLKMLEQLGYRVTFIPVADLLNFGCYTADLQRIGIECRYAPYTPSAEHYLQNFGGMLELVLCFRYSTAAPLLDAIRKFAPRAKVVLETVDLHFLRQEREAELSGDAEKIKRAEAVKQLELQTIRRCDAAIVLSAFELELLRPLVPGARLALIPLMREIPGRKVGFEKRRGIVFIGGFRHAPNVDAVLWFTTEVWPLIRARLPECVFSIVGANAPEEIQALAAQSGVQARGFVEDLASVFEAARVSVAPLRYGAGIKGKLVSSLSHGVPSVATPAAVEGMGLVKNSEVLVGESAEEFAAAVLRLYADASLWNQVSDAGLRAARERFSLDAARDKFAALLAELIQDP